MSRWRHESTEARFWAKVCKSSDDKCWPWTASTNGVGYGKFCVLVDGKWMLVLAHRFAWELSKGKIPDGMFLCHSCDNPPCVNPGHMFVGNAAANTEDMVSKGRARGGGPFGECHPRAKLNWDKITEIRQRLSIGDRAREIAESFGVKSALIYKIKLGQMWPEENRGRTHL